MAKISQAHTPMERVRNPRTGELTHYYILRDPRAHPPYGGYRILWKRTKEVGSMLSRPSWWDCIQCRSRDRLRESRDVIWEEAIRWAEMFRKIGRAHV